MSRRGDRSRLSAEWDERLARHAASGQTVAVFCVAEGVSVAAFHYHARKRRERAAAPSPFRRVRVTNASPVGASVTVRLPGGVELSFARDPELTRVVLDQLLARASSMAGDRPC